MCENSFPNSTNRSHIVIFLPFPKLKSRQVPFWFKPTFSRRQKSAFSAGGAVGPFSSVPGQVNSSMATLPATGKAYCTNSLHWKCASPA